MQNPLFQIVAGASAIASLASGAAWGQATTDVDRYGWGPHMMWWGGGWYAMILGPFFMILFLALLVAAVILLVRWLGGPGQTLIPPPAQPGRTALDILKERFARGEIDKNEFEERRRVLGE